jgi:molybdopterin converting factor small subunit
MNVEVRLFATLREYLPAGSGRTSAQIEIQDGARISDVLERLGIPTAIAHLVLVDGHYEADRARELQDGCAVSIWPPIGGG